MQHNEDVIIGGIPIEIIRKKNLKNLYIRINPPDGCVVVSSPIETRIEDLKLFVIRKLPEITKVRERMISQERQTEREYVSGESHYLWGKVYKLQVISGGNRYHIEKVPNKIIMKVPEGTSIQSRERLMTEWYREELKRVLSGVIERCEDKTGIGAHEYRIKNMKTRWGTCSIPSGRIWLNLQLAKKPIECLEYVVVHELTHLVEKNHTHRFYALMDESMPAWRDAKKTLSDYPLDPLNVGDNGDE